MQEAAAGGEPLDVRIGLATGEVVAGAPSISVDHDLRLTGEAITTAARIQSMARPGEILLDEATLRAARGRLATDLRGAVVLRGQSTAVELHALRGEAGVGPWIPFRATSPHPLVGRIAELEIVGNRAAERRHRIEQRLRVRMLRLRDDRLGRPDLDDAAEIRDRDRVADVPHGSEVVRHEDHRDPELTAQLTHEVQDGALHRDVER